MESRYKRDHGYSYGEMIQKQDALTVSELTEGVFSEWDDKLEIMGIISEEEYLMEKEALSLLEQSLISFELI